MEYTAADTYAIIKILYDVSKIKGVYVIKNYTIIAGINGTGKTSLIGVLKSLRADLGYIINADKIAADNNNDQFLAGKIAVKKIKELLQKQISFTQETTLSGHMVLKTIQTARDKGYNIALFYIGLDTAAESISRIKNRVERGGHYIDNETVIRRFNKRFDCLIKVLPYCNEVRFYDNQNGFAEVAEYKNGELITKGDYKPLWIIDLIDKLSN